MRARFQAVMTICLKLASECGNTRPEGLVGSFLKEPKRAHPVNPALKVEVLRIGTLFPRFLIAETGSVSPRYYTGDHSSRKTVWSSDPDNATLYAHITLACADAAALQDDDTPGGAHGIRQ